MIQLRHLLLATDLGPDSVPALAHARFLSEHFGARLTLYHAVPVPDHRYAHWAFAHGHEVWQAAERHASAELQRLAESLACPHEVVVERRSSPLEGILDAIKARQPDLAVLGTHGRDRLAHLLLGSVAEDVVERAFRSVICVPPGATGPAGPYRRLLVPTDFSLASRLAFPLAAFLAKAFDAEVTVLHVVSSARQSALHGLPEERRRPTEDSVREFAREDFPEVALAPRVASGHVWERIAHAAKELRSDLVVMSTRGHDSFSDRILGSNTERVLRHAPCPVLVA
jgi:nucleotide-binding universal stress UspA family protein